MSWMRWIGLIIVPAFLIIGLLLLILGGVEEHEGNWQVVGAILAGSGLIAGALERK